MTLTRTSYGGGRVEGSVWGKLTVFLFWDNASPYNVQWTEHACYIWSPVTKSQQCLKSLWQTKKIRCLPLPPAMPRASSMSAECSEHSVSASVACGTGKTPPDYRISLKTMSRLSQRRPWMLLPWQTYRVALERPHDYSQSLCDEVQLCPYYRVELVTQLLKETRDLPGLGAGLNTPDEQPWSVLAGRLGSGRIPK